MAQPHSDSSSTIPSRTGIWKCWFLRGGLIGVLREKPPRAKETEEPTKLQRYMLLTPGFEPEPHWSRGGECSH